MKLAEISAMLPILDTGHRFYAKGSNKTRKFINLYADNLRQFTSLLLVFRHKIGRFRLQKYCQKAFQGLIKMTFNLLQNGPITCKISGNPQVGPVRSKSDSGSTGVAG